MTNELYSSMEFLMKELHKEWDRTGAVRAYVSLTNEDAPKVERKIAGMIRKRQEELDSEDMTFKQSIRKSKESYILLRMARKIKALEDKTNKKGMDMEFSVGLDKEELKLYKTILREV